jgi:hypothetical protein
MKEEAVLFAKEHEKASLLLQKPMIVSFQNSNAHPMMRHERQ